MENSLTIPQVTDYASLIYAIARPYFHKRPEIEGDQEILNVEEVFEQFIATLFPYLENDDVLNDKSGSRLVYYILMGFLGLFKRIEADISIIDTPLNFSLKVISLIQNSDVKVDLGIISNAIIFLYHLFSIPQLQEELEEPRNSFIELLINSVSFVYSNFRNNFELCHTVLYGLFRMKNHIDLSNSDLFELLVKGGLHH